MIRYITGNILESTAQALVNTVNTVGVMGKGIALQFKQEFHENFRCYVRACKDGTLRIGQLLIVMDSSLLYGEKIIINFPTKTDWRKPSEYAYIETGLKELTKVIGEYNIRSIALPPLGAGNGGLEWSKVKELLEKYLSDIDCEILIYQPDSAVRERLRSERVALTPARAMLLSILYELVRQGEFVSEFAGEKVCYFLQRFGAKDIMKLEFLPKFYGPYSGKVKHVLYYLNGSYLTGYNAKDKKPFEELNLMMDAEPDVIAYLAQEEHRRESEIVERTKQFLEGYYDGFGLELLSTIDFIARQEATKDLAVVQQKLADWSERKTERFANKEFVEKGLQKLEMAGLV